MVKVAAMRRSRKQQSNNLCGGKWTIKLGMEVKWCVIDLQLMADIHFIFKRAIWVHAWSHEERRRALKRSARYYGISPK